MYKSILLALDLNEQSSWDKSLPAARDICRGSGGTLYLITVLPDYGMTIVGQYFPEGAEGDAVSAAEAELKKSPPSISARVLRMSTSSPRARCMNRFWKRPSASMRT